ncbi:MAG: hypothetical protein OEM22_08440 [Acidimicrobiia bacterium]|nr:hypothetical protein [Acidimicrobiia bacterium]MDH3470760.1 hypothetical protein [Acidimicrobiia bacterium]
MTPERRKTPFGIANLAGLLAGLWVVLAFIRPESTFHLAPILVGVGFPLGHRLRIRQPLTAGQAIATGIGSAINLAIAIGILTWADKLRGPSLLSFGGAITEAVVFGAVSAVVGAVFAALPVRLPDDETS